MKTTKNEVTENPVVQRAIVRTNEFATKSELARNALFDVVREVSRPLFFQFSHIL